MSGSLFSAFATFVVGLIIVAVIGAGFIWIVPVVVVSLIPAGIIALVGRMTGPTAARSTGGVPSTQDAAYVPNPGPQQPS